MSKSFNNKIKSYFTRCQKASLKNKIVVDNNNIYISDSYSIVKLFNNDFINKNKNDIIESFDQCDYLMANQLLNLYNNFEELNFNINDDIFSFENNEKMTFCNFLENKIMFDYNKILKIIKIINKGKFENIKFFTSEKEKNTICIVGCDGIAYLLGCVIL